MAFDSTPNSPNATSFLSVTRADEIASERAFSTNWTSISSNSTKEAILSTVSRLLSSTFNWNGTPATSDQALAFGRNGLLRINGSLIDPATIPLEIELATFEWALNLSASDTSIQLSQAQQGLTKLKAGPVELTFKDGMEFNPIPPSVLSYIPSSWYTLNDTSLSPVKIMVEML